MGMVKQDDGWRLPDRLWAQMESLSPPRKPHPLGCHNPWVSDRAAMDVILFVFRTGCQGNALNETGICSSSSAHRRFQEWVNAGVFEEFWIPWAGKKSAPIRRTAAKAGSSAAY
jgi:transposase